MKIFKIALVLIAILAPQIVSAAYSIPDAYQPTNAPDLGVDIDAYGTDGDYGSSAVNIYVQYFAGGLIALTGILSVWAIVNAGFGYATAAGNQEKLNNAKKELLWATLGLATVILSFFFIQLILNLVASLDGEETEAETTAVIWQPSDQVINHPSELEHPTLFL